MKIDKYGQYVFNNEEVFETIMSDKSGTHTPGPFLINDDINTNMANRLVGYEAFVDYTNSAQTIEEFDASNQTEWFMPDEYKELDIAKHVLDLCNNNQAELQRCGEELLMYQERDLFNLLRYLKYLVDVMDFNDIIWGVGRGSSVASFVLYKLRVHKVNSMYYDLDITEFLR